MLRLPEFASALTSHAKLLRRTGDRAAAGAGEQAVAEWRELDGHLEQPEGLATALDVLALLWLETGRPGNALPYAQEAVDGWERPATHRSASDKETMQLV